MPKFPHIRQKDAMDCGPSCLAMVAAHYGCQLDLAVLRERCFLAKDGVSLLGLSRAAERIGRHNCEFFYTDNQCVSVCEKNFFEQTFGDIIEPHYLCCMIRLYNIRRNLSNAPIEYGLHRWHACMCTPYSTLQISELQDIGAKARHFHSVLRGHPSHGG